MDFKATFNRYYVLSKPGIIYANIITAAAGYLLASKLHIDYITLLSLLVGLTLVIAGACAFNNYLDRGIDKVMARTKKRGLVTGEIRGRNALMYATTTSASGLLLLGFTQNAITTLLAVIALVDYVILYGWAKRKSEHGTLVGCISGAIPLVAGYTAITARLDLGAALLFIIMVAWQMAHFYGIALYRLKDYQAAHIPVMPAVRGVASTKIQVVVYIIAFIVACLSLLVYGYVGVISSMVLLVLGVVWLAKALRSYAVESDAWGRGVFLFSLIVMLGMSAMLSVGSRLA